MRTFVDEIAAHAAREPDRVALSAPGGAVPEVTYRELADRIEVLARTLCARGAAAETVCAVAVERGVDAVVALAAVVRSGAAFLSLDVEQPPARLAALARSGGAGMLLTTAALAERLQLPVPGRPVLLDETPDASGAGAGAGAGGTGGGGTGTSSTGGSGANASRTDATNANANGANASGAATSRTNGSSTDTGDTDASRPGTSRTNASGADASRTDTSGASEGSTGGSSANASDAATSRTGTGDTDASSADASRTGEGTTGGGRTGGGGVPLSGPDPRTLAYVSHTSGSTGEPSAVLVEHAGLDAYLRFIARDYRLGPDTVALQVAPPGYDASIRDTFAPLLAGGRLVLAPRSALLRPAEFGATVRAQGVDTLLSVTPSFLTHLAGQPDAAALLEGVRLVVSSGESLRPFLAAGGRELVPGALINQYGPTECTMTSTRYAVPAGPDPAADVIGTPIDGVVVRLLDAELTPAGEGRDGEVYIGGAGVARGYRGLPSRTAECFVPDPLGPPGARLYRTGDRAERGPDGELRFLGREDRQIKIRGYRVDPAEVEGALLTHQGVTGAVVTCAADDRGRVFLVAHVTGELADVPDGALRRHLATTLPPHLMPRRFVRLDRMPTTRSGKADRRTLAGVGGRS